MQNCAEYAEIHAFWDIPVAQARYSIEAFVCIDLTKNGLTVLQVGPSTT